MQLERAVGDDAAVTLLVVALLAPVLLLLLMLAMERVERPLRRASLGDQLADLDGAGPEEVEAFISNGYATALERYWRRRRLARLLPGRVR